MKTLDEKFKQTYYGPTWGDETHTEKYQAIAPVTVKELCDYILTTDEWGYIGIYNQGTVFGKPDIEYIHHHYCDSSRNPIEMNFPENILNAQVCEIIWQGGWSRGDWLLKIRR